METITVTAAIIEYNGSYLFLKRAPGKENEGLWEFPGGKLNPGESLQACLERELMEELGVKATVSKLLGSSDMIQGDKLLRLYGLQAVIEAEPLKLRDHTEFQWVHPENFANFPMTVAELGLINVIQNSLAREVEIKAMNVLSCAKLYGILYGILGIFMGMVVFFSSTFIPSPLSFPAKVGLAALVPFFNVAIGAVAGAILAFCYNLFASLVGGIKMRIK